ncbi:hypothetical protein ACOMHN_003365 [Nucella lapillus]
MARPSPVVDSRYRQKWSEMKKRHGNQPLQEVLGFYVCKDKMQARMIAKYGLRTGCSNSRNLGNPHQGVYLYRHVDLALQSRMGRKSVFIFVFQVHLGRTKRLPPVNSGRVPLIEPTPNFDAHVSNTPPHNDDTSADICRKSQMYLYEYTDEAVPSQYPPQCLPYALLEFVQENNQNRSSDALLSSEKASTSAADSDQTETVPMFSKKGESGVHRVKFQEFCKERDIEESSRASSSLSGQKSVVKSLTSEMSSQPSKRPLVPHTGPGKFDGDHQRSDNQSGQQSVFRSLTGVIPGYPTQQPSTVSAPETGLEQFKDDGSPKNLSRVLLPDQWKHLTRLTLLQLPCKGMLCHRVRIAVSLIPQDQN